MVGEGKKISVSDSEIQQLIEKLSPEAKKILEPQTTQQRIKTIGEWIVTFSLARSFNRQPGKGAPPVSQDELRKSSRGFVRSEKDWLLALPNDDDFNRD